MLGWDGMGATRVEKRVLARVFALGIRFFCSVGMNKSGSGKRKGIYPSIEAKKKKG